MTTDSAWSVPGLPPAPAPVGPSEDVLALAHALDDLLRTDPTLLPEGVALERARLLLVQQQRLHAAALDAVRDVQQRQLFARDAAGSARDWLGQQAAADPSLLRDATQLTGRPVVRAALAAGLLSAHVADTVARALGRLPDRVEDDQARGVLLHALPDLLQDRSVPADELASVVRDGLAGALERPADRLEPAFVLLARHLPAAHLAGALRMLTDALLPDRLEDQTRQAYDDGAVYLRQRGDRGWSGRLRLDELVGQRFYDELMARVAAMTATATDDRGATTDVQPVSEGGPVTGAEHGGSAAPDAFGAAGPGLPVEPYRTDDVVEGRPRLSQSQLFAAAFAALVDDAAQVAPGSGRSRRVGLTVVTTVDALEQVPGVLPAQLDSLRGPVPLSAAAVRRLGCWSRLSAVLLDAHGRPVGASGEHRHATRRERRALRARWGSRCGVNGCGSLGRVPHHAEPWWKTRRTRLDDLVPLCEHHHHDVHDGHRTLRLRDGRLLDENGWASQLPLAA